MNKLTTEETKRENAQNQQSIDLGGTASENNLKRNVSQNNVKQK